MLEFYRENQLCLLRVKANSKGPAPFDGEENHGVNSAKPDWKPEEFHGYNVGVRCGDGLLVVDIDVKRVNGEQTWQALVDEHSSEPIETFTIGTPSGGRHLYFRVPSGITLATVHKGGVGIDFQCKGSYVLIPPSVVDGKAYEVVIDSEIALAPDWLIAYLKGQQVPRVQTDINEKNSDLFWPSVADLMAKMPYTKEKITRDFWVRIGMILHSTEHEDAFELWRSWSAKDTERYKQGECERIWLSFKADRGLSHRSLERIYKQLVQETPVILTEDIQEIEEKPEFKLDIPCGGLYKEIVDEITEKLAVQPSYAYFVAENISSFICQRQVVVDKSQAMNFTMLVAGPNSQKSLILETVIHAIDRLDPMGVLKNPASAEAFQTAMADYPSRFYGADESLGMLLQLEQVSSKGVSPKHEVQRCMLKYFGSNETVLGNQNKSEKNSVETAFKPRLTLVVVGTTAQLEEYVRIPNVISSGFASRFILFLGQEVKEEFDDWVSRASTKIRLSDELLAKLQKMTVNQAYHKEIKIEIDVSLLHIFRPIFEKLKANSAESKNDTNSIFARIKDRLMWHAAKHCFLAGRTVINELDCRHAVAMAEYANHTWLTVLSKSQHDEFTQCMNAIMELAYKRPAGFTKSELSQKIAERFRGKGPNYLLREQAFKTLIDSGFLEQFKRPLIIKPTRHRWTL